MSTLIAAADRDRIEALADRATTAAMRRRAEVLLLYDQGLPTQEIAEQVELSPSRTRYWRRRYLFEGMQIFAGSALESPPTAQESPPEESPDLQLLPEHIPADEFAEAYAYIRSVADRVGVRIHGA